MNTQDSLYAGRTIRTYSGKYIDVFTPKQEMIALIDLAIGQAFENRWSNQNGVHYSVAQHACLVHDFVPESEQRQAIFHDSSEGILGDMPRPIKKSLPEFESLENRLMDVIANKYQFDWPKSIEVDQVDKAFMRLEFMAFMITKRPNLLSPWPAEKAACEWLKRAVISLNIEGIDVYPTTLDGFLENHKILTL